MTANETQTFIIEATVNASMEKVWECFNDPKHIMAWNNASADWHTTRAENDLKTGGVFNYRMESKDGKSGFDFGGTYDEVVPQKLIIYTIGDGRKVRATFDDLGGKVYVKELVEAETQNPVEFQQAGWQSILNNFKGYTEKI